MTPEQHVQFLRAEADAFSRVLASGDLDAQVPNCPGWTLADLAAHLGSVHRWARGAMLTGPSHLETRPIPAGRDAIVDWFAEGVAALHESLTQIDATTPCWTFEEVDTAAFWMRRQAHETAVHRWDAESSQGTPGGIDAALAADGVAEVVDMFFPRQVRLARIPPLQRSLRLAPDEGAACTLAGDGTGTGTGTAADAELAGPAEALLLVLWGRTVVDDPRLRLRGSRAAAEEVLAAAITP
ncbi:maleylpyruvate isomerase family mycothiol-dependent enzyme [Sporichthya sp.]|uniref:maleylpyruvate isomerase family mycothiol-dependent enzyme n=1 Tax=Sporichthya sp. TaxID=65475 RepID=UPI00181E48A6|nr:maleylpyruvate isomerase family mycothiol-dependent enzyme [Sporichthya sp.]MBA3743072.1 maleylpyruvate isomerase family mycothiol-dependent enzyme [Sporichthya sp.]